MNTLEKLSPLKEATSAPTQPPAKAKPTRRIPSAALPCGLLLAFLAVFALMFGSRLLPAAEVRVAPVVTLRSARDGQSTSPETTREAPPAELATDLSLPTATPRGPLLFQASGWVEPDPYATLVPTLINGVVDEVHVLEGEAVKKGQLLATLIDDDARLNLEEARQMVATLTARNVAHCAELPVLNAEMHAADQRIAAEEALLNEMRDISKRLNSAKPGSVSERDVIQARLKVERQAATVGEAKAELPRLLAKINKVDLERIAVEGQIKEATINLARMQLAFDRTRIHAPMDGIVLHLHAAPGKKRMLDMDDPKSAVIVELCDPAKLQARIDVPLSEAAGLALNQPVRFSTDLLPDAKFSGVVTRIVGEADLQRNTLQAKVRILDPDPRLRPEMLVRAEFFPGGKEPGPGTPASSRPVVGSGNQRLSIFAAEEGLINRNQGRAQAWIVGDDRAVLRDITLGNGKRGQHVEVLEGLRPGDKLILPPHEDLQEGKRVKITATQLASRS